jgi:hypothetical protein
VRYERQVRDDLKLVESSIDPGHDEKSVINSPIFFPFSDASRHVLSLYLIYSPIRRYEDTPIQVDHRQAMETGRPLSIYPSH